jgi:hypothetical protein
MDDTDATTTTTFFFATDGKSFLPIFNCFIRNTSKCQTTCLLIHYVFKHPSSSARHHFVDGVPNMGGSGKGEGDGSGTSNNVALYWSCAM